MGTSVGTRWICLRFQGLSKLTTKRLWEQTGRKNKKRRTTKGNGMESLEIRIDRNMCFVNCFFFFFSFSVLKGRGPCYFVSLLTMHAASIFLGTQYEERAWPRASTRTKGAKGRDFAVRTIINGFDLNFLFVWPPLMFLLVDRLLSCNLFFSLFIYFSLPPLPPFRLFGSYWSIEWKKVSTSVKIHGWLWKGFFQTV